MHRAKLFSDTFPASNVPRVRGHNVLTVTNSNHSMMTPVGTMNAEKIAEAILRNAFMIAFLASLLQEDGCRCV